MAWLEVTMNHEAFRACSEPKRTSNLIWPTVVVGATLGALFFLASCANKQASGQHATILMRDGATLTGTVTATSSSEITLAADDNTTHKVPMTQVKSIEYDDTAPAQTAATPTRPASAARAAADAMHE